jgi:ribosomal protein S18 acetylase RimI-like enzyme
MIKIREYKPQWKDAVLQVIEPVLHDELGFIPDANLDDDIRNIEKYYTKPDGCLLVVFSGDHVIGTGALRKLSHSDCEIKRMYLLPPYRGQGIGTQLLRQLVAIAKKRGYHNIFLDTTKKMKAANRLYKKFGFIETNNYNLNPRAQIFMKKELTKLNSAT